jgi:hypothetical protein
METDTKAEIHNKTFILFLTIEKFRTEYNVANIRKILSIFLPSLLAETCRPQSYPVALKPGCIKNPSKKYE